MTILYTWKHISVSLFLLIAVFWSLSPSACLPAVLLFYSPVSLSCSLKDPLDPGRCVMVIRSLVQGGAAERHGGLLPGDQLVSVNQTQLNLLTLSQAVDILKSVPPGPVLLGLRKPLVVRTRPLFCFVPKQELITWAVEQTKFYILTSSLGSKNQMIFILGETTRCDDVGLKPGEHCSRGSCRCWIDDDVIV